MDSILFRCSECKGSLKVDLRGAGRSVKCPLCGKAIHITTPPVEVKATNQHEAGTGSNWTKTSRSISNLMGYAVPFIICIAFLWGESGGIYHSAKKHSLGDAFLALVLPPFSWYRSIEFFWHNDFAGIDWNKRLKSDTKACIYFLGNATSRRPNSSQTTDEIETFSKKLATYPKDKRDFLKNASAIYISYYISVLVDFQQAFHRNSSVGRLDFRFSEKTIRYENLLKELGLRNEVELGKKVIDAMIKKWEQDMDDANSQDSKVIFKAILIALIDNAKEEFQSCYFSIFNENLLIE